VLALHAQTHAAPIDTAAANMLLGQLAHHAGAFEQVAVYFAAALAALPERRTTTLFSAPVLGALIARTHAQSGDLANAERALQSIAGLETRAEERAISALVAALLCVYRGAPRDGFALLDQARLCLGQSTYAGSALLLRELAYVESRLCAAAGDWLAAAAAARAMQTHARRHGAPAAVAAAALDLAEALMHTGNFEEASRHASHAAAMFASCGSVRANSARDFASLLNSAQRTTFAAQTSVQPKD
jgi:hypothetical protein